MNILIGGASGLVGRALAEKWRGVHHVSAVGRDAQSVRRQLDGLQAYYSWSDLNRDVLAAQDVVINLAGENVGAKRWCAAQKERILSSRVDTTGLVANSCAALGADAPRLINAGAIGIYGTADNHVHGETDVPAQPEDFLGEVGRQWEAALLPAQAAGVPVTILRFAVILSPHGGALAKLLPSFKLGLGAVLGDGSQAFSWVALADVVAAVELLLDRPDATGAFNIVADEIVTQRRFAATLAAVLRRPRLLRLPAAAVRLLFGQMGQELLLSGIKVDNARLKSLGFRFRYPDLRAALTHLLIGE